MLHKYIQRTLPVLGILLSHPAVVVGGEFDSWWNSITDCPECSSSAAPLYGYSYSIRSDLLALPTEKREMVRQFPFPPSGDGDSLVQCAKTPSELNQGDVNKAAEWVKKSILNGGGRVNDDSDDAHQVTTAEQIDLSNPTEVVELARHGARAMVVDTSYTMGVVTQCTGSQDVQFIGKSGEPLVNSNGEGKGVIEIPPDCPKKLASQRKVRNTFVSNGINISNCSVCNDDTSRFVRKQEFVDSIRQVLGNAYHSGLIPSSWNKKERLYKDEFEGVLPGIIEACKRNPECRPPPPPCSVGDLCDSNRFFDCIENQYPSYFPGPGTTEVTGDGYGSIIYFRYYALYQCGPCGQYASESYLATYQRDTYYAFDGYWEYLAPLDDALVYFCPGW